MRNKFFIFIILLLFAPVLGHITLVRAHSGFDIFPPEESPEDVWVWENAWTKTLYVNGTPTKSIFYSGPQMVWNGTDWIEYEIKPINETAVILRTPTCAYLVSKLVILLLAPNGTLHVSGMEWVIEQYSVTLNKWLPKLAESASVNYNSTHVWQKWTFPDESERVLYIGYNNKQTVTFTSKASATYRVTWYFTNIDATRIIHSNGTDIKLDRSSEIRLSNFNFTRLTLYDQNKFSLLVDYNDVDRSYYREFISGCSETGLAYVNLIYGNWTINSNESITVDPITETFISEDERDGTLYKDGTSYPPTDIYKCDAVLQVGQLYLLVDNVFQIYRSYVSFDTSSIRDYHVITNATLKLKTCHDSSTTDFTMRVMGGSQPIYGDSFETDDWNCSTTEVATWPSSEYPGDEWYINITIPTDEINRKGRTQFELKSNLEGTQPTGEEYVIFYDGSYNGSEPQLEIFWEIPSVTIDGYEWYYCNANSDRAAIVLFGGYIVRASHVPPPPENVYVVYLKTFDVEVQESPKKGDFVEDLYINGYSLLLNKERLIYWGFQELDAWLKNAAMWLKNNQSYQYRFLFGFSGGGTVVAYEIQKDYAATLYNAAVVASAPVNTTWYNPYGLFLSAQNASKAKVCTSFIEAKGDRNYYQMLLYHDNMILHKEWHNWNNETNGVWDPHDVFKNTCADHPNETVSDVAYNWYQHPHLTVLAKDQYDNPLTTGDVYIDNQWRGLTGSFFNVSTGNHTVRVNHFWESGNTGYRYGFKNWTDGSVDNPRTIKVGAPITIIAYFKKKWCPGDANGDGIVNVLDLILVQSALGSHRGDPNWNSQADVNGDGIVNVLDVIIVQINMGNKYPDP